MYINVPLWSVAIYCVLYTSSVLHIFVRKHFLHLPSCRYDPALPMWHHGVRRSPPVSDESRQLQLTCVKFSLAASTSCSWLCACWKSFNTKEWKWTASTQKNGKERQMMCLNPSITCSFEKAGISDSAVLKGTVKLFMFQHVIVGKNGYTFCVSAPQHKWIQWGMALSRFHRRLLAQMPVNYRLRR